ncbi:hypothetical protein GDO78_019714 [Eleutherodactylus coqui]|uniref:Uncharacterized protein n=1 Tax=Eleutherodactylus coqui TaxID=57060 RepID=A0A8J6JY38_ELECQ|nr:hypothetical protein GDO78_019714 [Eleutherodactylus coqui]
MRYCSLLECKKYLLHYVFGSYNPGILRPFLCNPITSGVDVTKNEQPENENCILPFNDCLQIFLKLKKPFQNYFDLEVLSTFITF